MSQIKFHLYWTISCKRRRQENIRQRNEKIVLFRYIERRLLGILESSIVD